MATVKNAAPRFLFDGFDDNGRGSNPATPLAVPTHCPMFMLGAAWGPETDQLVSGGQIKILYGDDVFDRRAAHFTHQNLLAETVNAAGNQILVKRIVAEDAPAPAGMTVWAELVADNVPNTLRNADGSYKVDPSTGQAMVDPTTPTLLGSRVRIFTTPLTTGDLGQAVIGTGDMVGKNNESGKTYPLFDLQRPHRGSAGNRGGVRLTAPTIKSSGGTRDDLIEDQRAFLYSFQAMERLTDRSSPLIKTTLGGDQSVMFSFKEGVYDKNTQVEYGIEEVLLQKYNARATDGGPDTYGTFSGYFVYEDNLEILLRALHATELPYDTAGDSEEDFHMVNFLTGMSYLGYPYHTIKMESPSAGGLLFTDATVHYAQGGADGTFTPATYDAAVGDFIDGFMEDPSRLWDPFRVPVSVFYDTGYTLPVKLKFPKLLSFRDDIYVVLTTQVWDTPANDEAEDYSIGLALSNELLSYPESTLHGTGCCRGMIIGHAGVYPAAKVKSVVPLAHKWGADSAAYMGAGDGIWVTEKRPDTPGNNVVTGYTSLNARSKTDPVVDDFWSAGIIWAQYKNRRDQFIPAYQTVYTDDTSPLNSAINMIIAVDIVKVCRAVWTELVGLTDELTDAQFIQKSNDKISAAVAGKYDGRVRVIPNTYFTPDDSERGYSWSCLIDLGLGSLRTVGSFTVRANRLGDLAGVAV
jgi:hypothetical protein